MQDPESRKSCVNFLIALRAPICASLDPLLDQVERRTPQFKDWLQPLQRSGGKEYHGLPCQVNGQLFRRLLEREKIFKLRSFFYK